MLEQPFENSSSESSEPVSKARRPKSRPLNKKLTKKGQSGSKLVDGKQSKKSAARKPSSKSKSAVKDKRSCTRSKKGGKGVQYEDDEDHPPNLSPLPPRANETANLSEVKEASGHNLNQNTTEFSTVQGSVYSYAEHEMIDELFSPTMSAQQLTASDDATIHMDTSTVANSTPVGAGSQDTTKSTILLSEAYKDTSLQNPTNPSASTAVSSHSVSTRHTVPISESQSETETEVSKSTCLVVKRVGSTTTSDEVPPSTRPSSLFNIDDLFGF